ncbi:MAG: GNAT family N-acetyltransferase [Erysipelotrichaceae bacterium]|nr:GNAT family N-acetyltransferase [Erysipelotrichaceae bacterium]
MKIIDYFEAEDKEYWLKELRKCKWSGGEFLCYLLDIGEFKKLCGETTRILLLTDKGKLLSFCTYAEKDDIQDTDLTPWVGFVFTFEEYRNRGYIRKLLEHAYYLAQKDGYEYIYISTNADGLYEKYGYSFWKMMKDFHGEDSRIYRIKVAEMDYKIRELKKEEISLLNDFLYEAIFIPEGMEAPDRDILNRPELQVYVKDFYLKDSDCCLVSEKKGKVIGAVWSRIMNDYGHIDDDTPSLAISILPEYRNTGIGTALMREMFELLHKKGFGNVSLAVQKDNYALKMYEKLGFEKYSENSEEYIMIKEL